MAEQGFAEITKRQKFFKDKKGQEDLESIIALILETNLILKVDSIF